MTTICAEVQSARCRAAIARRVHDERIADQALARAQQALPFAGRTPLARHCSRLGAEGAAIRAASQVAHYLRLLLDHGPQTDHEAARALGIPVTSVCARRGWCIDERYHPTPLVEAAGKKPGPFGTPNVTWQLTGAGRQAAQVIQEP